MEEIVDLEKQGWKALSSSQESAKNFYGDVLMDGAVMIFSGGMRLQGKEKILASFSSQPWDDYHLEDIEHKTFSNEVALLTIQRQRSPGGGGNLSSPDRQSVYPEEGAVETGLSSAVNLVVPAIFDGIAFRLITHFKINVDWHMDPSRTSIPIVADEFRFPPPHAILMAS